MSRNQSSDDAFESNDLFEDDRSSSNDDRSIDDTPSTSMSESRGKGRGRGRNRGSDDDDSDKVTGIKGKAYTFELGNNNEVTNLMRIKKGVAKPESIDSNETWLFTNGNLIKSETYPNGIEVKTYSDANEDGIFTFASESFMPI